MPPRTLQQVGLVEKPFVVTEHRAYAYWCDECQAVHYAPFPDEVRAGGLLDALKNLFDTIHQRDRMTARGFARALKAAKRKVLEAATRRVPAHADAQTLAKRMRENGEAYFTFVTTPGVEPTNNVAEQALRFVVIDRRITQGTRGERGRRWCERIWSVVATCAQQGRSVYQFLVEAVHAHFAGARAPSLLPSSP